MAAEVALKGLIVQPGRRAHLYFIILNDDRIILLL
jgi:hypothetical protein